MCDFIITIHRFGQISNVNIQVVSLQPGWEHSEIRKIFRASIGPQGAISQDHLIEKHTENLVKSLYGHSGSPVEKTIAYVCTGYP